MWNNLIRIFRYSLSLIGLYLGRDIWAPYCAYGRHYIFQSSTRGFLQYSCGSINRRACNRDDGASVVTRVATGVYSGFCCIGLKYRIVIAHICHRIYRMWHNSADIAVLPGRIEVIKTVHFKTRTNIRKCFVLSMNADCSSQFRKICPKF
jgi:hypothetical protein